MRLLSIRMSTGSLPPKEPKDLVSVPIMMSTSEGSTPSFSHTPLPFSPRAPMECASSRYR